MWQTFNGDAEAMRARVPFNKDGFAKTFATEVLRNVACALDIPASTMKVVSSETFKYGGNGPMLKSPITVTLDLFELIDGQSMSIKTPGEAA